MYPRTDTTRVYKADDIPMGHRASGAVIVKIILPKLLIKLNKSSQNYEN